jgi:hypothetical protein
MKTGYTKGFEAGVQYARNQLLEFLNSHYDLGDILTLGEIIHELNHWEIKDYSSLRGLSDGRLAQQHLVAQCKNLCEDCFGTDLCLVCEGVAR